MRYAAAGLVLLFISLSLWASDGWQRIDAVKLMQWLKQSSAPLVLDIRGIDAYRNGSIAEALNTGADPVGFLPDGRGGAVVLIASQPVDRGRLAAWLARLHDSRHEVFVLEGGLPAWRDAGGEVIEQQQSYVKPGTVPFVIPKGLCEGDEPAQKYE
jgi:rhodanese-related sulfurtransferase